MATMLSARSKKIVKERGVEADEFEEQVAQVCIWFEICILHHSIRYSSYH